MAVQAGLEKDWQGRAATAEAKNKQSKRKADSRSGKPEATAIALV